MSDKLDEKLRSNHEKLACVTQVVKYVTGMDE